MKKIIATGKGGVGKTTIIATLARLLAADGYRVLVVDTDPSMNLAMSLGIPFSRLTRLSDKKAEIRDQLGAGGGDEAPGHSHALVDESTMERIIMEYTVMDANKVRVMVMGSIPYGGSGCICSSIALVKLIIGTLERTNASLDFIIVDSQAGSEVLGRGLAAEYDYNLVVTETSPKALDVALHVLKLAEDLGVKKQIVVANKVADFSEIFTVSKKLGVVPDDIYPVAFDNKVIAADREARLILDFAPESAVLANIQKIKNAIEADL